MLKKLKNANKTSSSLYLLTNQIQCFKAFASKSLISWRVVFYKKPGLIKYGDVTSAINDPKIANPQIFLFPNPAKNQLTVKLNNATPTAIEQLEIYNMSGQLLQIHTENKSSQNAFEWQINTANFAPGIYIVKISANNGLYQSRFIKM